MQSYSALDKDDAFNGVISTVRLLDPFCASTVASVRAAAGKIPCYVSFLSSINLVQPGSARQMGQLPMYNAKLASVKKDMISIVDKTARMKRRTEKLKQKREKIDRQDMLAKERERMREEGLRAKVAIS